jgi:hypothetical protein
LPPQKLTAVVAANSYAAWRINVQTAGEIPITVLGAHTGDGYISWVQGGGWGGAGFFNVQLGAGRVGIHEALGVGGGESGGGIVPPGIYYVVSIVGGGTVSAGFSLVQIHAPPRTKVLGFTSGPAIDLTDANFTKGGGLVIDTPVFGAESMHGAVARKFKRGLFGYFWGNLPAKISYTDPSGTKHESATNGFSWFGAPRGTYKFRVDGDIPPHQKDFSGPNILALMADIRLP